MKKISIILALFFISTLGFSQTGKQKVYFLVDTINIPKEHRLVEIGNDYEISYTFLCGAYFL